MIGWDAYIADASQKYNIDPRLISSVIQVESGGNPNAYAPESSQAVKSGGARGLGQQTPATAKALGIDPTDPRQSIEGVAKLLDENLRRYGTPEQAVLAYHGGTDQANWGPRTQAYLQKVSTQYGANPVAQSANQVDPAVASAFQARFGFAPGSAAPSQQAEAPAADYSTFQARFGFTPGEQAAPKSPESVASGPVSIPQQASQQAAPGVMGALGDAARGFVGYVKDAVNPDIIGAGAIEGVNRALDAPTEWLSKLDGTYDEQVAANKARRAAYDATRPGLAGQISQLGGEFAATAGPLGAAGTALSTAGKAVTTGMRGTEALAGLAPGAEAVGNFVAGNGGMLSRIANGAIQGGAGGALMSGGSDTPIGESIGVGAVLGGASAPLISGLAAAGSKVAASPVFNGAKRAVTSAADVAPKVDEAMSDFAAKMAKEGTDVGQMPADTLAKIRAQVTDAFRTGKEIDPAALARKLDFESVGMSPTLGQVTRDPTQFASERNMRGIQGAGEPLANRFNEQNSQINALLSKAGAQGAVEPDVAGNALINRLQALDQPKAAAVSDAYNSARDTVGRYAELNVPAFSNGANKALDEQMLGRFLPPQVQSLMNDISSGKIPLNVNTAVQADSVMSAAQRAAMRQGDTAGAKAIGVVRDNLNSAPIADAAGEAAKGQFDAARKLAAQRFSEIEGVPALKAALGEASPDKFVQKYIISGDTPGVNALGKYMQNDPESLQIARNQIAGYLQSKGFGANAAGDSQFSQAAYNKALNTIGTNKLNAFFTPEDVAQLKTIGRVGAYINSQPAGSAVNNSNTASAVANILGNTLSGIGKLPGINIARDSIRTFTNEAAAAKALGANVKPIKTTSSDYNSLLNLLAPVQEAGSNKNK